MCNRSANATILGYLYQFDLSIMKILDSQIGDSDEIELEGIEDIDIKRDNEVELYQCKYYSETEYNHSVIKDAIISMFKHFKDNQSEKYSYNIHGHFKHGTDKLKTDELTIDFMKNNFLSKNGELVVDATDDEILSFKKRLNINIKALSFDKQESRIIEKLKGYFTDNQDKEFVEIVYLSNARTIISKTCSKKDNRVICRKEFIYNLKNKKRYIENSILITDDCKYIQKVNKTIKSLYLLNGTTNKRPATRFVILDVLNAELGSCEGEVINLITNYHEVFSNKNNSSPRLNEHYFPFFIFPNLSKENLEKIKFRLYESGKFILDEYPFKVDNKLYNNITDTRFNNNEFRPFKILSSLDSINYVLSNIRKENVNHLKEIQVIDLYRISPSYVNIEGVLEVSFPQNSIKMLEEFIL